MNIRTTTPRKARGFSLLELIIVLGLVGLAIVAIFYKRDTATAGNTTNLLADQYTTFSQAVRDAYPNRAYANLTAANLCQGRGLASMCNTAQTALSHVASGSVTPTPTTVAGVANSGVQSVWSSIPGASCAKWLNRINGDTVSITVGSTTLKNATTSYDPAVANTACNNDTNSVTIVMQ